MFKGKTVFFWLCFCRLYGVFADELKSVKEGDSVTLNSSLTEIQKDEEILWTFGTNGILIAKTNGVNNTIYDVADGRFRDRLKLDNKTGSLIIVNIRTEHAGVYEVEISDISSQTKHRFNVTVCGPPSGSSSGHTSLIVLISAAAAVSLLIVAAFGMIWICRKHRKIEQGVETRDEEITYADPTFYKRKTQKSGVKQEDEVIYAGVVTRR
ncbi:uncharacterized protein LOC143735309 [Siphateles boraxobius]|uniref:uncharacterized protein LOC143735309 n=1 Tax=Siphateles boraxobius TaxID=180520 RepID=UPI004064A231